MRMLSCKRYNPDNSTQEVYLNLEAVDMVANFYPPAAVKNGEKVADKNSCAVVLRSGAAMRINYSPARLLEEMRKA